MTSRNHRFSPRAWTLVLAPILALVLLAYAGSAAAAGGKGHPKDDPKPSQGQDCQAHGNNNDGNEDHCSPSLTPSPTPVVTAEPTPVVTPSPTPVITPEPTPVVTPEETPVVTPTPSEPAATTPPVLPNGAMSRGAGMDVGEYALVLGVLGLVLLVSAYLTRRRR